MTLLLPLLAALAAAPVAPGAAVVVTRRAGLTEAQSAVLAQQVHAGLARAGVRPTLTPEEAIAKLPPLQITDRAFCDGRRDCVARLGVLLGVAVVVVVEVGRLGETVAMHLEAVDTGRGERLAQQDLLGTLDDLSAGKGVDLAAFAQAVTEKGQAPAEPAPAAAAPAAPLENRTPLATPAAAVAPGPDRAALRAAGFAVGGLGLAALGTAVAFGVLAKRSYDEADQSRDNAVRDRLRQTTATRMDVADSLYVVGGVALATGVVLAIVGLNAPAPVSLAPARGGASLVAGGSF